MMSRIARDRCVALFVFGAGGSTMSVLILGLALIGARGLRTLSWNFLVQPMQAGGLSGGIRDQMLGTLLLLLTTLAVVLPLSLGIALLRSVYLRRSMLKGLCTTLLHVLNGVPSILFGIVGFWFFVKTLGWGKSWLSGGLLLAMMVLPTTSLALIESLERVPRAYREQASALGLMPSAIVWSVLIPQSLAGLMSGILLGLARAAGETAPIMFTATVFSGAPLPHRVKDSPVLSLPYHIFNLTQESYQPQALHNAWGATCVLLAIAIGLSLLALPIRLRLHEEAV